MSKRAARRRKRRPPGAKASAEKNVAQEKTTNRAAEPARADNRGARPPAGKSRHRKRSAKPQAQQGQGGDLRGLRAPSRQGSQDGRDAASRGAAETGRGHRGGPAPAQDDRSGAAKREPTDSRRYDRRGGAPQFRGATKPGPLYAALDLGTNNCRLLIAEPQDRGFRVVDAFSRIVRLGEGIGRTGRLSQLAMDRAVDALAVCRSKMADHDVRRMRLIATEACRAADNGPLFLDRVHAETGLKLEIVNRETEARLAVAGCVTLVDPYAKGVLLFDIGGGSSELVWLDLREKGDARGFALTRFIRAWTSLPVGVVTLSERHGGISVTREVFEAMVREVNAMLDDFEGVEELGALISQGGMHMLGTSGTVTTLAGVHLGLKRYDRRKVDGVWLKSDDVGTMINQLLDMPFEERIANPCIGTDRADLVMAGCAILEAIRRRWPCERLRVADRGLREGILVELMARDGVWRRRAVERRAGVNA
ncbi:Ppx/GppA phosphatase family protein [Methylobrevis pamukkalensis]|uniref:Exopolyphosphatase n=1 Tax=Methylobrevis pamukkalensis TaxID=1439726 RepID=A0A1E3H1Y9_9HYPH|nr:Ppx/GppA phosphatase family protein [Methylobrevis pamukkalensis]ODN70155.1 Exopolyphosphatase [Methylobrevis pamukkalensis]